MLDIHVLWCHLTDCPQNISKNLNVGCCGLVDWSIVMLHIHVLPSSHLHSRLNAWLQRVGQRRLQDEMRIISILGFGASYIRYFTVWCHLTDCPQNISKDLNVSCALLPRSPSRLSPINTLRPIQNGRHFADDTFKLIFIDENVRILIIISLKFVSKCLINNIPALVQIMAWRQPGDKPLSEQMMVNLLTHICVTRPQWVKSSRSIHNITTD